MTACGILYGPCTTALLRFAPISNSFRTLTHPFFPLSGKDPCRDVDVVPDGSNPGRNSVLDRLPLPFHPRGYSIQIMPISDDLNKWLQFARMPARNVNYITRGGASSKRELPRVGWMRRFKRGWWNTRQLEGREKKKGFSRENAVGNTRLRLLLIWCRRATVRFVSIRSGCTANFCQICEKRLRNIYKNFLTIEFYILGCNLMKAGSVIVNASINKLQW